MKEDWDVRNKIISMAALALVVTGLVTYLWAATPEAIYRASGDIMPYTSSSADFEAGDVISIDGDKRAGIVVSDIDYSVNPAGSVYVGGVFDVACSATVYWLAGEPVYWDYSANTAIKLPGDGEDFYLGLCVLAKSGSATSVRVSLNEAPVVGLGGGDIVFFEDFVGYVENTIVWQEVDVGDATEAMSANAHGGVYALAIAATDEAEDAVVYFGDQLQFDIDLVKTFECRVAVTTPGSGVTAVWGLAGAHNLDKDTVAQNAWFRIDGGSMVCDVETDDASTDNDDKSTSTTLVSDTFYTFKIDMTDKAAVKFYIDGVQVPSATTYVMSNATAELQPYFSLDKASGASTGGISIDWVRVVSARE